MPFTAPILYVEDELSCAENLAAAMKKICSPHQLMHVSHGEEAVAYLSRTGKYADRKQYPMPGLIIIDWRMPRMNGRELLTWIREKSGVPWMPAIILTVSRELKDVEEAYRLGAQSFLIKPVQIGELTELLRTWESFWLPKAMPFALADV